MIRLLWLHQVAATLGHCFLPRDMSFLENLIRGQDVANGGGCIYGCELLITMAGAFYIYLFSFLTVCILDVGLVLDTMLLQRSDVIGIFFNIYFFC
jgi:hypothetical protein